MDRTMKRHSQPVGDISNTTLAEGLGWGVLGGLAGTLTMNLVLIGTLSAVGLPAFTGFLFIGNTAASFFSHLGNQMAGGVSLGAAVYYLVGPAMGAIFGAAATRVEARRVDTLKKSIVLAVLYVEILSQPLLAMTPILLKVPTSTTLLWFGSSFGMHLILGIVMGAMVSRGLRWSAAHHPRFSRANPVISPAPVARS
jgi:hypothetical protein